MKTEWDDII